MRSVTIVVLAVAGIAFAFPAAASPSVSGETQARAAGPVVQFAQYDPNDRAKGTIGLGYTSKKSKTSKMEKDRDKQQSLLKQADQLRDRANDLRRSK